MRIEFLCFLIWSFLLSGCINRSAQALVDYKPASLLISNSKIIIQGSLNVYSDTTFDNEVVIMPQAYISTYGSSNILFLKRVTVIGSSHVFDSGSNISFGNGVISVLNPCWFGANGWDDADDTPAFKKAISLAKFAKSNVNILVSVGRYIIKEQLVLENEIPNEKAINLIGESISGNTIYGSCLQWHGAKDATMLQMNNLTQSRIENIEFTSYSTTFLKHNVKLLPAVNQISFNNCSFNGCKGNGSANVNLNKGNNAQVSEISFDDCVFRGLTMDNENWLTESAVVGGLANTKNFYFRKCSFLGYKLAAINIDITEILNIENCTFSVNDLDILCSLCNSHIVSNYSEQSKAFFASGSSMNISYTTMMNNYFDGHSDDDFVIREGSGNLVLINNSFGGTGWNDQVNRINWKENELSSITSIGNFYRNAPQDSIPFYTNNGSKTRIYFTSLNDIYGLNSETVKKLPSQIKQ